MYLGYLMISL